MPIQAPATTLHHDRSTASANYKWAVEFVRYSLDGGRYAYQAAHAYAPGGKRDMQWKGWTGR